MQSAAILTIVQLQVYEKVQNVQRLAAFFSSKHRTEFLLLDRLYGLAYSRSKVRTPMARLGDADGRTRLAQRVV
jgi:hypothetical protein